MSEFLSTIAGEYEMEPATEGVKEFFTKICDGILWLLRKLKEIILKIITSIKSFFTRSASSHPNSIINSAIREYRTVTQNITTKDNDDIISIDGIPGLNGDDGSKPQSESVTDRDVKDGETTLTNALESVIDTFKPHIEEITKLMGKVIGMDEDNLKDQINIINKLKDMSSSLRSTQPIADAVVKGLNESSVNITQKTSKCRDEVENFIKANDGSESKVEQLKAKIKKNVEALPKLVAEKINRIFSENAAKLITSIKTDTPNFTTYLSKIESHAEHYKKSADTLSNFVTDIKNSTKSGSKLNDATEKILNNVQNIVKVNMAVNTIFGKLIALAKANTI